MKQKYYLMSSHNEIDYMNAQEVDDVLSAWDAKMEKNERLKIVVKHESSWLDSPEYIRKRRHDW